MATGIVTIKSEHEIGLIRESSLLVGKALGEVSKLIEPGVSTSKLDQIAEELIRDHGGIPAFKNYRSSPDMDPYPYTLCVSVNQEVVHGMPVKTKVLKEGDIVSVDCGVLMNGYYGDSAYTFGVGEISSKKERLLKITLESLYKGIEAAVEGNSLGDIGHGVQYHVEAFGYSVVREMVGHGIGKNLHEPPEVPNYGKRRSGLPLKEGMCLAIEPMVNMGKKRITFAADGWTVLAADGLPSAHFEHTIVVRKGKAEVLSTHEFIVKK